MPTTSNDLPRVTIVMTARERHGLAVGAIESIVENTPRPYRFVYLDVQSPVWLRDVFAQRASEWGLEVVRYDERLWPQQARARFAAEITSEYVVFIDNDVQVYPGWLQALVDCADRTGAGVVGPLYLWGGGIDAPRIHMAGGRLSETKVEGGRVLDEAHQLFNADYAATASQLRCEPCGYIEYHCMLIRGTFLAQADFLDRSIYCVHEHIDTALSARRMGLEVYFEPAAKVNYLAFSDYRLDDLEYFRQRWSPLAAQESIARFCQKWQVIDDARSFGGVRDFVQNHAGAIDPLRYPLQADRHQPMASSELVCTRAQLLDLALARGCEERDVLLLADAYGLAHILMDGGYRPCGRPFINHLVGTAGVLLRFGFRTDLAIAAMLHAAYSHGPSQPASAQVAADAIALWLGGKGSPLERRVRSYSLRDARSVKSADTLTQMMLPEAEQLALVAANEIEMHFSGEFRYTGRADTAAPAQIDAIEHACGVIGVEGLAATLIAARQARDIAPAKLRTEVSGSYRIRADRRGAVSMLSNAINALHP